MDFGLNEEQGMLVDTLRSMGKREDFKKLAVEIDRTGEFPTHLVKKYADLGLLGMTLSPEYGGGGQPGINAVLAIEELAKFSPLIAAPVFESNIGPVTVIDTFGTQEQKRAIIPGVCKGELSVSVSMTEPEAGSDLTSLSTRLVEEGMDTCSTGARCSSQGEARRATTLSIVDSETSPDTRESAASWWRRELRGLRSGSKRSSWGCEACRPAISFSRT